MATRIVGLDFGRHRVRAVEVENALGPRPVVTHVHEVALPDGAVRSGEVHEASTVTAAIKRLWSAGGFSSKSVVLGMGNQRVIVRELAMPRMNLAQIREALPFQVQDMLPVPVAEAVLDFYPISEGQGEQGPVVNGLLVAAIKQSVLTNVRTVAEAGLDAVQVDLVPFALSRVLLRGPLAAGTLAIIDVGAGTTNVVIATGGVPQFVRMIPFGSQNITDALSTQLTVGAEQAETLKRDRGLGNAAATSELDFASIDVIRASALDLLTSIRNTLSFFASTHAAGTVESVVLTGGGARLDGFDRALTEMLRLEVIPGDAFSAVTVASSVAMAEPRDFTVALGLALGSAA